MKRELLIIISVFLLTFSCKESTTEPEPEKINDRYYLIGNNVTFNYDLSITDTTGFTVNGNRYISFTNDTIISGTTYKIQRDSFETFIPFDTLTATSFSFIRETNGGVYTFADTTGFTGFLPDSLRQYLSLDRESRLLFYPLTVNQAYPVYTLTLSVLIIGINVIDVDAKVEAEETINLFIDGNIFEFKSYKIKYDFVIRTSSSSEIKYSAYAWAVKDFGFIKWDGDSEVINFLFNKPIFPPSTTVKMQLKSFHI